VSTLAGRRPDFPMNDPSRQPTRLFSYGTGVSLRAAERRTPQFSLIVLVLLVTAIIAGVVLIGFMWLATADYSAALTAALDLLVSATRRG
jgi:hypothetical protein